MYCSESGGSNDQDNDWRARSIGSALADYSDNFLDNHNWHLPSFYNDTAYMKEMIIIFGTTTIGNHYVPFYNRRGWRLIAEHDILSRL